MRVGAAIVVALVVASWTTQDGVAQPPDHPVSWLATGDSYSSGEGIAGTGVGDDVCARSERAYGPLAATVLGEQRSWTISTLAFTACTGATAGGFYAAPTSSGMSLWEEARSSGLPDGGRFDVVTMSLGGNDVDFPGVILDCLLAPVTGGDAGGVALDWRAIAEGRLVSDVCHVTRSELSGRIDYLMEANSVPFDAERRDRGSLPDLWDRVVEDHVADDGVLVVVGYPRLFADVDGWAPWRGNRCEGITRDDARILNDMADELDAAMRAAASTRPQVLYVSRRDLFLDGGPSHSLCSRLTEWLNGISVGFWDGSLRPSHSFHPNEQGHVATAEEVADVLDAALGVTPPPVTTSATTEVPISAGARYDIGERFEDRCVVAWPTAPMRGTDSVQLRMSCLDTPSQFLFVDVVVRDPDLPVSPSTGYMGVRGEIVDVIDSEYGFRVLAVLADEITFE